MDLEEAANTAQNKVKELEGHVDEGESAVSALHEACTRVGTRLDEDFDTLAETAGAFLERAGTLRTELASELETSLKALQELNTEVAETRAGAVQELEQARADAEALTEQVTTAQPGVTSLQEQLEQALQALSEQANAVEQQLQEGLGKARDFLQNDVAAGLAELQQAITDGVEDLASAVGDCRTDLEGSFEDWQERLSEVREYAEGEFTRLQEHAHEVAEACVQQAAEAHREKLQELGQTAERLIGTLGVFGESLMSQREDLAQYRTASDDGVAPANDQTEAMLEVLQRVKDKLASFSFVT
jgi:chromosome segregation ATPase